MTATPVHNPGLDHLLEEVAAEVLRQDAADDVLMGTAWMREACIELAARALRSVRAIDQDAEAATPCTARQDVHEEGVTAVWHCAVVGAHKGHQDSIGRWWTT